MKDKNWIYQLQEIVIEVEFIKLKEKIEKRDQEITRLQKQLDKAKEGYKSAFEFMLKTTGESEAKDYNDSPDWWHDIGWEKDLEENLKLAREILKGLEE